MDALGNYARMLNADLLVWGHTHENSVKEAWGKYFVNPGSVTGAYSPGNPDCTPSFTLMAA